MITVRRTPIPIPPRSFRKTKYPWSTIQVGQSFFVPNGAGYKLHYAARRYGIRITQRQVKGGLEVWRVA